MLIVSNQSLAEFNLTKEPDLVSGKERLCEMYEEAEKLYKSVTEKVNTLSKYNYLNTKIDIINISITQQLTYNSYIFFETKLGKINHTAQ